MRILSGLPTQGDMALSVGTVNNALFIAHTRASDSQSKSKRKACWGNAFFTLKERLVVRKSSEKLNPFMRLDRRPQFHHPFQRLEASFVPAGRGNETLHPAARAKRPIGVVDADLAFERLKHSNRDGAGIDRSLPRLDLRAIAPVP